MNAPANGFPGVGSIESMHAPSTATEAPFQTIRIKIQHTDRVLQLGTMASAHVAGSFPFRTDTSQAAEFPSYPLAILVRDLLSSRLNRSGATTWSLVLEPHVHESTESWAALHRMERTALEMAYLMAETLPKWVKR